MEVRESSSKVLGFNGLQGDALSFRESRNHGCTVLNKDKYVCHVKSLLEWQNVTILLKMRRIRE